MDDYWYIYKDSLGKWNLTTNPQFIASHQYCRAIPKKEVIYAGYELISDFLYDLNDEGSATFEVENLVSDYELQ
jgi:hypothetical protein